MSKEFYVCNYAVTGSWFNSLVIFIPERRTLWHMDMGKMVPLRSRERKKNYLTKANIYSQMVNPSFIQERCTKLICSPIGGESDE